MNTQEMLEATLDEAKKTKVGELSSFVAFRCQMCDHDLVPEGWFPSYDEMDKIQNWTLAQLIAFRQLQVRSGLGFSELLERTSGGVMPGIGGAINGDVGTIGVSDFHGMFVGIEPDGHTHS